MLLIKKLTEKTMVMAKREHLDFMDTLALFCMSLYCTTFTMLRARKRMKLSDAITRGFLVRLKRAL